MKRILIDYKKLDHALAARLIDAYPYGYGDDDIITIKKPNGEVLEVVEVRTEDTIYLVKISKSLSNFIANLKKPLKKSWIRSWWLRNLRRILSRPTSPLPMSWKVRTAIRL